jgi:hypothetical protein
MFPVRYELGLYIPKTTFFSVTAVETSNLTCYYSIWIDSLLPIILFIMLFTLRRGHAVAQLVEALFYKPECSGLDS